MKKSLSKGFIDAYVKFRTSGWYVASFAIAIIAWIFWNKVGFTPHFDNSELTYLNLLLSVLAELQSILLLVYAARMTERNERADKQERHNVEKILARLNEMSKDIEEIGEDVEEISDEVVADEGTK